MQFYTLCLRTLSNVKKTILAITTGGCFSHLESRGLDANNYPENRRKAPSKKKLPNPKCQQC